MHWNFCKGSMTLLGFYGITKDPETKEFIMIVEFANRGNLKSILSTDFNNISWKVKVKNLWYLISDLYHLHSLEYCHKDFHSGNILYDGTVSFLSDFGLSRPADEQKFDG